MSSSIAEDPVGAELLGRAAGHKKISFKKNTRRGLANLRPLSRVNVMSVCHPSVDRTGSIFFASSSRLAEDNVCIKTLISACAEIVRGVVAEGG